MPDGLDVLPRRAAALREMGRVTVEGGAVAVLVPARLDEQPAYEPFVEMAVRHAGPSARSLLSTYFACADVGELTGWLEQAGLRVTATRAPSGTARFPSVEAFVATEVQSTPLGDRLSRDVYARILDGARDVLAPFTAEDGQLDAPFECSIAVGRRP